MALRKGRVLAAMPSAGSNVCSTVSKLAKSLPISYRCARRWHFRSRSVDAMSVRAVIGMPYAISVRGAGRSGTGGPIRMPPSATPMA